MRARWLRVPRSSGTHEPLDREAAQQTLDRNMQLSLHTAANGHLFLEFGDYDSKLWEEISRHLEAELGFNRVGDAVVGCDEGIRQSFERNGLLISAGWDNWSGDYLLSESSLGDELLQSLFGRFRPNISLGADTRQLPRAGQLRR